jgi:2-aminoadipate transaminase
MDAQINQLGSKDGFQGNVIRLGSFSKLLGPGLRLGWAIAPAYVIRRMAQAKQGVDLHTSLFVQMVVHELLREGFLRQHVTQLCAAYRERRDMMLSAMERYFPPEVRWTKPQGGLFIWVALPTRMDASVLLKEALAYQVTFIPGSPFYADKGGAHTLRLNFSYPNLNQIEEGIRRLGEIFAYAEVT